MFETKGRRAEFLRMFVSCRAVVTMIHPENRNARLGLARDVEDCRLVRTEIRGNDGAPRRLENSPLCNLKR